MNLDTFNLIAGLVTIGSLIFSLWAYWTSKRKEAVEAQKLVAYQERLQSSLSIVDAALYQAKLVGSMSDREETTKKEIKHLTISILATLTSLRELTKRGLEDSKKWSFGVPARYLSLEEDDNQGK